MMNWSRPRRSTHHSCRFSCTRQQQACQSASFLYACKHCPAKALLLLCNSQEHSKVEDMLGRLKASSTSQVGNEQEIGMRVICLDLLRPEQCSLSEIESRHCSLVSYMRILDPYPWGINLLFWLYILLCDLCVLFKIIIHADSKGVVLIQPVLIRLCLSCMSLLQSSHSLLEACSWRKSWTQVEKACKTFPYSIFFPEGKLVQEGQFNCALCNLYAIEMFFLLHTMDIWQGTCLWGAVLYECKA